MRTYAYPTPRVHLVSAAAGEGRRGSARCYLPFPPPGCGKVCQNACSIQKQVLHVFCIDQKLHLTLLLGCFGRNPSHLFFHSNKQSLALRVQFRLLRGSARRVALRGCARTCAGELCCGLDAGSLLIVFLIMVLVACDAYCFCHFLLILPITCGTFSL